MNYLKIIKYCSSLVMLIFLTTFLTSCKENRINQTSNNNKIFYESNPNNAKIITSDIDLFWKAYDKVVEDSTSNAFQKNYIENSSQGVIDFIPNKRIVSADALKKLVLAEKAYYDNIRESSYKSIQYEKQIRSTYYALKYLYPEARFPPLYFIIGRTTSGGTATDNGIVVAIEVFSDIKYHTNYGRPSLDLDLLPFIVAHEIIHFLQKDNEQNNTLLKHCIREGSADFISELTAGDKVKLLNGEDVYTYGNMNEKVLWEQFKEVMYTTNESPWLYNETKDGSPQNLGYWMGYKIVEAYYNKALDKKKAIEDILNIEDYSEFLDKSHYKEKFK